MTHPHDAVRVAPVGIDAEGQIEVFGLKFWSEEATRHARRIVALCVAHAPHQRAAVLSLKGELLCHVELIDDGGLTERREQRRAEAQELIDEAQHEARDIEADARALIVRGQAELLIDLIDKRIEHARLRHRIGAFCRQLAPGHGEGFLRRARAVLFQRMDVRGEQRPHRHVPGFEIAKAIFEHPHAILGGHGHRETSFSVGDGKEAKRAAEAGHCLSEVAK